MPTREVLMFDGEPEVIPCRDDLSKLIISDTDRFYISYCKRDGIIYKLHLDVLSRSKSIHEKYKKFDFEKIPDPPYEFVWIAMHNSITWSSPQKGIFNRVESYPDIKSALKAAINYGWKVFQMNGDDLLRLLPESMRK